MSLITTILRAAHCRSTHHYFAIDALDYVQTDTGHRLANLLLKYHDEYLIGAKAPDKSFRDFQNHVLHVADNFWGGAPKSCEKWLRRTIEHLNQRQWKQAAYACGVLSHYFTDPFMPLHTAQSDRESLVHRPMEWSVCKSYNVIYEQATQRPAQPYTLPDGEHWISEAVIQGATTAYTHYHRLVEIYDLERGCKQPEAGLNEESRQKLADLFSLTTHAWGSVVDRIAVQAAEAIPDFSLGFTALMATIDMPLAWVIRKVSNAKEQRAVKQLFAEYEATGTLQKHLPPEISVVQQELIKTQSTPLHPSGDSSATVAAQPRIAILRPADDKRTSQTASPRTQASTELTRAAGQPASRPQPISETQDERDGVSRRSDLVDAPSIGPKTAARFSKIGIHTIEEFLSASPSEMATQLGTRWITEALVVDWQDQAELVCDVSALCGYKAQLLVAAECRSRAQLAAAKPGHLAETIRKISMTAEGKRILRSSAVPTAEQIAEWVTAAKSAAQRAA